MHGLFLFNFFLILNLGDLGCGQLDLYFWLLLVLSVIRQLQILLVGDDQAGAYPLFLSRLDYWFLNERYGQKFHNVELVARQLFRDRLHAD